MGAVEEMMCVVCVSVTEGKLLRVRRGSISSELLMCGGGVRIIFYCLLCLYALSQ